MRRASPDPAREPRNGNDPPHPTDGASGPGTPPLEPADPNAADLGALFVNPNAEPTDDSPTIISRVQPRPVHSEGMFAGTLRGRRLAHFELIEPIGVGGMAAVIRARDTQLDRPVALKILPPEMANDPEAVRRFHQEARAAARLDHENIARVFFCGEDQGLHFIAFEFVEGPNLRTVLERRGRLPVAETVHYLLQIATGLEHAASRGVVHRDIKPSNLIISPNGRAKLVDMGLARALGPHPDQSLTQSGVTLGTFDYISPEQALEPRDADVRSDIYSLGCTFYHVLTAQPPVPEGTAARKLHHHQHVAPIDPRQLNPEIPDEVAAILARMMAKDPKDRYQSVTRLVQHLIVVAQRLGVSGDLAQAPLFVDAPLPDPPRARPILLGALAAAVLVGLVLVLGQLSGNSPPTGPVPYPLSHRPGAAQGGKADQPPRPGPSKPDPVPGGPNVPAPARPIRYDMAELSLGELAERLKSHPETAPLELVVHGDLNFDAAQGNEAPAVANLVLRAPEVLVCAADGRRPTIRLKYDPSRPSVDPVLAALVCNSSKVTIRGLQFIVDAASSRQMMAGVRLVRGETCLIENCEFLQFNPPVDAGAPGESDPRLTSVVVDASPTRVRLDLRGCFFARLQDSANPDAPYRNAQDAVRLAGAVVLTAKDCAFAPHGTLFRVTGGGPSHETRLRLENCSAMAAGDWTAFHLGEKTQCQLHVTACLFARVDPDASGDAVELEDRRAVLIRQLGEASGPLVYKGSLNRYYNLNAFWVPSDAEEEHATWEAFVQAIRKATGEDDNSQPLKQSPWPDRDPLRLLRDQKPKEAFQVSLKLRELRQSPDPKMEEPHRQLIGVERCTWGRLYASVPTLPEERPEPLLAGKDLIVDPTVPENGKGVYSSLNAALALVDVKQRGGIRIRIRHNGPLPIEPLRLEKAGLDVTIVPDPDHHPILTLGATTETEAFLFRVHDGKLTLENLEFLLEPRRAGFRTQSVVELIGDGSCTFRGCSFTLDRAGRDVPLAAVRMPDPSLVMRMDPSAAPAQVQLPSVGFEDCFVRGDGDLVRVRASRPFVFDARNCLLALSGSCLNVRGNPETAKDGQQAVARFDDVTAYLAGPLVLLNAGKDARGLVPLRVTASDCLFVSRDGNPLVHLDGPETNEEKIQALLPWQGKHTAYANFMHLLDQQAPGDEPARPKYGPDKWKDFTGEGDALFVPRPKTLLPDVPAPDVPLPGVSKTSFKVKADGDQPGYGANVEKLPAPAGPAVPGPE